MNLAALAILIVAADLHAPIDARPAGAVPIYTCNFETANDINYDQWPDLWTRHRGPGYPHFLEIEIRPEKTASGGQALHVELDGGAAAAMSPPIAASENYAYWLEGRIRTEGLVHDEAYLSLTFLDENLAVVRRHFSKSFRWTDDWQDVLLGPIGPKSDKVRWVTIGVHVEPTGNEADLRGLVAFDDLWLGRVPRLRVDTTAKHNFYTDPRAVEIEGSLTGATTDEVRITFELLDALGRRTLLQDQRLTVDPFVDVNALSDEELGIQEYEGEFAWHPRIRTPGFFIVRTTIVGPEGPTHSEDTPLAVIDPWVMVRPGPFGWSMPQGAGEISDAELPELLSHVGISRLKYPLWFSEDRPAEVERLILLVEELSRRGIEVIGLLNNPPQVVRNQFNDPQQQLLATDVFTRSADLWYPSLEPVMTRFLMRTRMWQLGDDRDWSWGGQPALAERVGEVKRQLDVIGQDLQIGLPWQWEEQLPSDREAPWRFVSLSSDPPLSRDELRAYLASDDSTSVQRWVNIEPLAKSRYSTLTRVKDLVDRMVAAKIGGAKGIFVVDPFDPEHGLLHEDGTPGELLLPWRTTAMLLCDATYAGQLMLPDGATNEVFLRDSDALLVVSHPVPHRETLALGDQARQIDVWGRSSRLVYSGSEQSFEVDRLPSFVVGIDPAITRWRQAMHFRKDHIPTIFGRALSNSLLVTNTFAQGVSGQMTIIPPPQWRMSQTTFDIELPIAGEVEVPFEVTLPLDANTGEQPLEVRFDVVADRRYRFSAYPTLSVGNGDVTIELSSYLDDDGALIVQQRVINRVEKPITLKCHLFPIGRLPLRTQIVGLSNGSDVQVYRIEDGRDLIGTELSLRAQEIDGPRLLHYTFVAEP